MNDYFELFAGLITLSALIAIIYQIWNEKKERKADVVSLRQQTSALENIASNGIKQTDILINQNQNLEVQNSQTALQIKLLGDFLEKIAGKTEKDDESKKWRDFFEAERRRVDIMPYFFLKSWGVNYERLNLLIQNRGATARNLEIIKDSGNLSLNKFDSIQIEKNEHISIRGKLTSFIQVPEAEYPPGKTPVSFVLQYNDVDQNTYNQTFDFPNGMRSEPVIVLPPDLIDRFQSSV